MLPGLSSQPSVFQKLCIMNTYLQFVMSVMSQSQERIFGMPAHCFPRFRWLFAAVSPAPQPEPASRLKSATSDFSFLRSDSRCRRYVSILSNITPRYLGSEQSGMVSLLGLTFNSRLASLLLRWKTADTVFVMLSFKRPGLEVFTYSRHVFADHSFHCLPIFITMHDCYCRSSAYA